MGPACSCDLLATQADCTQGPRPADLEEADVGRIGGVGIGAGDINNW